MSPELSLLTALGLWVLTGLAPAFCLFSYSREPMTRDNFAALVSSFFMGPIAGGMIAYIVVPTLFRNTKNRILRNENRPEGALEDGPRS